MNKIIAIISYIISSIFLIVGLNKMFVYEGSEYSFMAKNAYVGGDAYNYIINANYATAWFVLAVGLAIIGTLFLIKQSVEDNLEKISGNLDEKKAEERRAELQKIVNS